MQKKKKNEFVSFAHFKHVPTVSESSTPPELNVTHTNCNNAYSYTCDIIAKCNMIYVKVATDDKALNV